MVEEQPAGRTEPDPERKKIRVGVIFGGRSGEHEVSLMSARSVMAALNKQKYEVVPIGIDRSGQWLVGDVMRALQNGEAGAAQPATLLPAPTMTGLLQVERREDHASSTLQPVSLARAAELDVIFPVLHGPYGEDGTVQGLLELAGLPYVGAGVVGSAVGMDKAIFKQVMVANNIPVLPWRLVRAGEWRARSEAIVNALEATFSYPLFTKPANLGSSVGISRCSDRTELLAGIDEAARYDRRIIVEKGISARELEVSVLGNDAPIASVVGEVRPRRAFYDYVAKYVADDSELLIPAPLPPETAEAARALALKVFVAIDCAGLGRVDLLLDRESGELYVNEINTIPGFTRISMYPKLWEASGIGYPELLDRLIELALNRHAERSALKTTYTQDGSDER
ncbi:MAG: D-alanine--D-alanine ligase family protein [Anaerolineae bacterium]|nr:D-alanine--D-alanine ligase family protein [Anaerolineae bacterium]